MAETGGPQPGVDQETLDLIADLNNTFSRDTAASRNRERHAKNQPLGKAKGKAPERMLPEDSERWKPIARVTYITRQLCSCCNNTVEFIGGEFIQFQSKADHAKVLRRAENCPNLFLYDEAGEPLPDLIDEFSQTVTRCPGCILVEAKALEIWDTARQQTGELPQQQPLIVEGL